MATGKKDSNSGSNNAATGNSNNIVIEGSNNIIVGAVISFFFPGLGLLLSKDKKMLGIMVFVGVMIADVAIMFVGGIGAAICLVPGILFLLMPVFNLVAALHTHDELQKESGGKPILFK